MTDPVSRPTPTAALLRDVVRYMARQSGSQWVRFQKRYVNMLILLAYIYVARPIA